MNGNNGNEHRNNGKARFSEASRFRGTVLSTQRVTAIVYAAMGSKAWQFSSEAQWDSLHGWHSSEKPHSTSLLQRTPSHLRVMGWHPYWMGTRYKQYRYDILHTVAYFSYAVDPQTGSYKTVRHWKTTELVPIAHQYGTRVVLCVTNFGSDANRQLLTNPQAKQVLIDSLVALVKLRNADGVNIDFELIPYPWLRDSLTAFLRQLTDRFHQEIPGSEVSIALPAVDWYDVFDVAAYDEFLDYCVLMGYEYHWTGSSYAGPVAPLSCGTLWGKWCVDRSVSTYLAKGLRPEKLWLGVPYYGREWPVADTILPAKTTGTGTAYTYEQIVEHRLQDASWHWDESSMTPYSAPESPQVSTGWHYLRLSDRILLYPPDPAALPVKVEVYTTMGQRIARGWVAGRQPGRQALRCLVVLCPFRNPLTDAADMVLRHACLKGWGVRELPF